MPKLLIKLIDHTNPEPAIDMRGAYKRGMVIVVVEDAHVWGRLEHYQTFLDAGGDPADWHGKTAVINLTGIGRAAIADLEYGENSAIVLPDVVNEITGLLEPAPLVVVRRRLWKIDIDNLPPPFLGRLETEFELTMPAAALAGLVRSITANTQHPQF